MAKYGRTVYPRYHPYNGSLVTRSGRTYGRYTPTYATRIVPNVRRGVLTGVQSGASLTRTMSRRQVTSGQGVTDQYNRKLIYRKQNVDRVRRLSWKRFRNKVLAVSEKDLGSKTVVFNFRKTWTLTGIDNDTKDLLGEMALYPIRHQTSNFLNDMNNIAFNDPSLTTSSKFIMQSGVLDVTFTNTSQMYLPDSDTPTGWTLELDIYEIICSKNFETQADSTSLIDAFGEGATDTPAIWGTSITLDRRGVTPFDLPSALSEFGIKILKKTKYEVGYLKSITYQIRDPKRHVLDKAEIQDFSSTNKPNLTRWLLFNAKAIPGFGSSVLNNVEVVTGITRKYMYKSKEFADDQDHSTVA